MFLKFYEQYENITLFITRKQLLNLSFYLGHKKKNWLKIYNLYILFYRLNYVIFNLDYSQYFLFRAFKFLNFLLFNYGKIFILSYLKNKNFSGLSYYFLKKFKFGAYYDGRYQGGLISNFFVIQKKKKKITSRFSFNFKYLRGFLPSLVSICDSAEFFSCFAESLYLGLPNLGIIDSDLYQNCMYSIFGNNRSFFFNIYIFIYLFFLRKKNIFLRKMRYYIFLIDIYRWLLLYILYIVAIKYEKYDLLIFLFNKYYEYSHDYLYRRFIYRNIKYTQQRTFLIVKQLFLLRIQIYKYFLKKNIHYKNYQKILKIFFLKRIRYLNELSLLAYFYKYENFQTAEDQYFKFKYYNAFGFYFGSTWSYKIWKLTKISDLTFRYYTDDTLVNYYDNWFKKIEGRERLSGLSRYKFKQRKILYFFKLYIRQLTFIYGKRYLYILLYKILKRRFKIRAAKILLKRHRKLQPVKNFYKYYIFQVINLFRDAVIPLSSRFIPNFIFNRLNYRFFLWSYLNRYYLYLLLSNRGVSKKFIYKYKNYKKSYIKFKFKFKKTFLFQNQSLKILFRRFRYINKVILKKFLKAKDGELLFLNFKRFKMVLKQFIFKQFYFRKSRFLKVLDKKFFFFIKLFFYKKKKKILFLLKNRVLGFVLAEQTFSNFFFEFKNIKNIDQRLAIAKYKWEIRQYYLYRICNHLYKLFLIVLLNKFKKKKFKKFFAHLIV
jgi:ribosomal protein S2